ncbi:MAG: PhzF family phenazine biosynthesis protein [Wenzhouxiangellaceae bacterium]
MRALELYRVNAFSDSLTGGNPAGVCVLDAWLQDAVMQTIATENGWSETAFVLQRPAADGGLPLRWFTPGCEVDLCGHATLATAAVLQRRAAPKRAEYLFNTRSGRLSVLCSGNSYRLDLPLQPITAKPCPAALAAALGAMPQACYAGTDYLLHYASATEIRQLQPDFAALQQIPARGFAVTAEADADDEADFVSRWFGGRDVAVAEDPVTGSAHAMLAPYWQQRLGRNGLLARQLSARGGSMHCEVHGDRVWLTGCARLVFAGKLWLDEMGSA